MTIEFREITRPRYDETLYSVFARASVYLGSPLRSRLHQAIIGSDVSIFDDLPVGIDRVVASAAFGAADLDGAVHEWTMFPYYAHFASPGQAQAAMMSMAGSGQWPHQTLACGATAPEHMRFCSSCRVDMLEQRPDAWWRRSHQMPSALLCPDHGEPLKQSLVGRSRSRNAYIAADVSECPPDAPATMADDDASMTANVLVLARASDALLDGRCEQHPDDRREAYLGRLNALRLLNRAGEAKLPAIAAAMDVRWGPALKLWPELVKDDQCVQGWLGTLLMGKHASPPLHHLLLEGLLDFLERWR